MKEETNTTKSLALMNKEIAKELADPAIGRALLATTFKGLSEQSMKQAIFEGVMRGFKFKDFLERNVYAIPFKENYSLVTSIDYARKKAMRAGVVGKSAPSFTYDEDKKVESCTITVKRKVDGEVGEWTATVFMDEYHKAGKNGYPSLWDSKPRTMLAKVAESHALRMACPEELSQTYTEEEFDKEKEDEFDRSDITDDTEITSTGDDMRGYTAPVVPESETERKALIIKELKRIDPTLDVEDVKELKRMVADLTELEFVPQSYANIIWLLAKK